MAEADTQSDSKSESDTEPETDADADSSERCQALTAGGNRCSRPAREDGFCHQHDESDPTVSESETAETDQDAQAETTDPEDVDVDEVEIEVDDSRIEGVLAIRKTVQSTAGELIGHPFDGVSEITATETGWRAVVEVIERRAVPDTQDIIGRYEIELDEDGVVEGYRRLDRYRRGDTAAFE